MRIGVVVFDGVEELDLAGPYEVLSVWARWFRPDVEVVTVSMDDRSVRAVHGLMITSDQVASEAPALDVVVYPGGQGTRGQLEDGAVLDWVRERAASASLMTSVCTGSLVYAAAGLLDGRPATTHWASLDRLAQLGSGIEVRPDDRFVDDGDIVTAAGVSAGIDMALHLVSRLGSVDQASEVRRFIQYDPAPPV